MTKPNQKQAFKEIKPEDFILHQNIQEDDIDYKQAEQLVNEVKRIDCLSTNCYTVFDYYKNKFTYISENTPFFKVCSNSSENPYAFLIENSSKEDIFIMHYLQQRAFDFLKEQISKDRLKFVFSMNTRMICDGKKIDTTYRVKPQILDKKGNIWISIGALEVAQKFEKPLVIQIETGEMHFLKPIPKSEFKPFNENLSRQEILILSYFANGYSSEKICKQLKIKMSTYKTHRCKIYKKLGVDTKISAINRAFILGLID